MGAIAAASWAGSARGDPRYGGKWAWLARRIARQAAGRNGRCALTGGFLVLINGDGVCDGSSLAADSQARSVWCSVCIHQMNRVNYCNGLAMIMMTAAQHHKHCPWLELPIPLLGPGPCNTVIDPSKIRCKN